MSATTTVRERPAPTPGRDAEPNVVPTVLIRVPSLEQPRPEASRPIARGGPKVRRRRRLRSEVRWAAVGLIAGVALSSAAWWLRPADRGPAEADVSEGRGGSGGAEAPEVPAEPSPFPEGDPGVTVAFPGYLLPPDEGEEGGRARR